MLTLVHVLLYLAKQITCMHAVSGMVSPYQFLSLNCTGVAYLTNQY